VSRPGDSLFNPYYQRVLNGEPRAIIEYCDDHSEEAEPSFYEIIGRLLPLRHNGAVKHIIAKIGQCGVLLNTSPAEVSYQYWYCKLESAGKIARAFIRKAYEDDVRVKREQLWNPYVDQCYICRREDKKGAARSQNQEMERIC